jgi:Holliday junction resolvase RusA-like endonuclease
MRVEIRLDGPPRGKGAGRATTTTHGARIFTDDKTRKYEAQLRFAAQQEMAGRLPTAEPVMVRVQARFQIPAAFSKKKRVDALAGLVWPAIRPDCENLAKALDGLNGIVWQDDRQIVIELISKVYGEQPGLMIVVETLDEVTDAVALLQQQMREVLKPPSGPLFHNPEIEQALRQSRVRRIVS